MNVLLDTNRLTDAFRGEASIVKVLERATEIWVPFIVLAEIKAGFLAGKCFARYRRQGGPRRSPLPDFYIGAHAAVSGLTLLTRDPARYRTYFPALHIIAPARAG